VALAACQRTIGAARAAADGHQRPHARTICLNTGCERRETGVLFVLLHHWQSCMLQEVSFPRGHAHTAFQSALGQRLGSLGTARAHSKWSQVLPFPCLASLTRKLVALHCTVDHTEAQCIACCMTCLQSMQPPHTLLSACQPHDAAIMHVYLPSIKHSPPSLHAGSRSHGRLCAIDQDNCKQCPDDVTDTAQR
jgi:hypothetical protein